MLIKSSVIKKPATIFTMFAILFAVSLAYLSHRNGVLQNMLSAGAQQCQDRIARLERDFQAELGELQQYLLTGANPNAPIAAIKSPDLSAATRGDDEENAAEAFKKPALQRYDESMEELVARKYRFLFTRLDLSEADRALLEQLLIERERIALLIRDIREYGEDAGGSELDALELELAEIDRQIEELLGSHNFQRYELLKDSDNEQHHFTQFTLGINGVFPLNNGQQENVMFAKIRHQKIFEASLKDSGLYANYPLTQQQKDSLYATVEAAAERYRQGYLQEIKQYLDASSFPFDQYTLVENYTNTEFKEMLEDVRKKIDARPGA